MSVDRKPMHATLKINRHMSSIINKVSNTNLGFLSLMYVLGYVLIESLLQNSVQLYIFTVFLALSGIYFSWFIGGKWTMRYVAFFNVLIVFVFSKLLWNQNIIVTPVVFQSKSFFLMYVITFFFIILVFVTKSPADARQEQQSELIEKEKLFRQNFEFMVASRKLKQDLLAQANLVKDELQLIEGAWRSNIHDIINDLPPVKEQELYNQIILPFQNNIISHLRELELKLTFDLERIRLSELYELLDQKIKRVKTAVGGASITISKNGWTGSERVVDVDKNKMWDMVQNVLRNSQATLDLKRINMLRTGKKTDSRPCIDIRFDVVDAWAEICIVDNGDGVSGEVEAALFKEPVLSKKRNDTKPGQGTLFVKFFADRMNISVDAKNVDELGERGLAVTMRIPLKNSILNDGRKEG
ncbi:MAG: histidine kinase [Proteobacteria bacterium]|nr:histidine kinase [Pseudomonadota bacterium]